MIRCILTTFIVFMISMTAFSGTSVEIHEDVDQHAHQLAETESEHFHSETHFSCDGDDCSSTDECCVGNCGCPASLYISFNSQHIKYSVSIIEGRDWFYYVQYSSPSIDPALKPPLHS